MNKEIEIGDSIKSLAECERLTKGTIVGFAHPLYQGPASAVRIAIADGSLHWSCTSFEDIVKTRTIKQAFGWAPFVVLALPGKPELNSEVRTGYRTYGTKAT